MYSTGEEKLREVIKKGYIESTKGFKLHLMNFESFQKKYLWMQDLSRDFWNLYRIGKQESQKYKKAKEEEKIYKIVNLPAYNLYKDHAFEISQIAKRKSEIFKLCLNNPTGVGA